MINNEKEVFLRLVGWDCADDEWFLRGQTPIFEEGSKYIGLRKFSLDDAYLIETQKLYIGTKTHTVFPELDNLISVMTDSLNIIGIQSISEVSKTFYTLLKASEE
jgi:hypothetical protein